MHASTLDRTCRVVAPPCLCLGEEVATGGGGMSILGAAPVGVVLSNYQQQVAQSRYRHTLRRSTDYLAADVCV